ncbi:MAG: hypothetical protein KKA56_07045, partial [Gammaproteobacteria bacterium]|nr:hypothetical protein [Gammaproteobacteria bacterium]
MLPHIFQIARLALIVARFAHKTRHSRPAAAGMPNRERFATRAHDVRLENYTEKLVNLFQEYEKQQKWREWERYLQ